MYKIFKKFNKKGIECITYYNISKTITRERKSIPSPKNVPKNTTYIDISFDIFKDATII